MTDRPKSSIPIRFLPLAVALIVVIPAVFLVVTNHVSQPTLFVRSAADIDHATFSAGSWYWVRHVDDAHDVLERAESSGAAIGLARADEIGAFVAGNGHLFVTARIGKVWKATLSNLDGSQSREIWSGTEPPNGALISGDSVYWLRPKPAVEAAAASFPPLGPQIELISTTVSSGESKVLSTIMEPEGLDVIGVNGGEIWLTAHRSSVHGVSTIYRIPASGGPAERVIGETGGISALLTADGTLYWTAPSIEAQNFDQTWCICKRNFSGKVETLTDWLPSGGRIFNTQRGIWYVDGNPAPLAWPVTTHLELPRPIPIAGGYFVVAAGETDLVMRSTLNPATRAALYRMWPK